MEVVESGIGTYLHFHGPKPSRRVPVVLLYLSRAYGGCLALSRRPCRNSFPVICWVPTSWRYTLHSSAATSAFSLTQKLFLLLFVLLLLLFLFHLLSSFIVPSPFTFNLRYLSVHHRKLRSHPHIHTNKYLIHNLQNGQGWYVEHYFPQSRLFKASRCPKLVAISDGIDC